MKIISKWGIGCKRRTDPFLERHGKCHSFVAESKVRMIVQSGFETRWCSGIILKDPELHFQKFCSTNRQPPVDTLPSSIFFFGCVVCICERLGVCVRCEEDDEVVRYIDVR
jgi:hypothetical protein